MVKVTGPMHSDTASGTYAKALTFSRWKNGAYVRSRVIPANPRTEAQVLQRSAIAAAGRFNTMVEFGSAADVAEKAAAPSGQSGASYFARLQAQRLVASKAAYLTGGNATVKGYFDTAASDMGLLPVTIPGATTGDNLTVTAGLILWNAYEAMHVLDDSLAPTIASAATTGNIDTFQAALEA